MKKLIQARSVFGWRPNATTRKLAKKYARRFTQDELLNKNNDIDKKTLSEFAEAMKAINATRDR